jgi:hypothetical protein
MIPTAWLVQASTRIASHIRKTPLTYDSQNRLYLTGKDLVGIKC